MTNIRIEAFIGSTDSILHCMFPDADAHVIAWRRAKWLQVNLTEQDRKDIESRRTRRSANVMDR